MGEERRCARDLCAINQCENAVAQARHAVGERPRHAVVLIYALPRRRLGVQESRREAARQVTAARPRASPRAESRKPDPAARTRACSAARASLEAIAAAPTSVPASNARALRSSTTPRREPLWQRREVRVRVRTHRAAPTPCRARAATPGRAGIGEVLHAGAYGACRGSAHAHHAGRWYGSYFFTRRDARIARRHADAPVRRRMHFDCVETRGAGGGEPLEHR